MQRDTLRATIGIALAALAIGVAAVWWQTPQLHVDVRVGAAIAHMELLGEYPSDIRSIEIARDDAPDPVWRIAAIGDMFQIHSVSLVAGANPADLKPDWGFARRRVPPSATTFQLMRSVAYRITICPAASLGLCRSTRFMLPAA
jgi:hypothetical protein